MCEKYVIKKSVPKEKKKAEIYQCENGERKINVQKVWEKNKIIKKSEPKEKKRMTEKM